MLLAFVSVSAILWLSSARRRGLEAVSSGKADSGRVLTDPQVVRTQIDAFCGDCHAVPHPATFPRDAWFAEVRQGFSFYYESGRNDLAVPLLNDVVAYYRNQAPERLELPVPESSPGRLQFQRTQIGPDSAAPAVSFLNWSPPGPEQSGALLGCDMRSGEVRELRFDGEAAQVRQIASLSNPAGATRTDLDRDGKTDLLVAELGSFEPGDHQHGKVIWMRQGADREYSESMILLEQIGRVADVQPADFDGDGDLDLVVAEFGWRKTGGILLLENSAGPGELPRFQPRVLDHRHGTIHVPVADLNHDGSPDFVALISQEYEVVEAFLNRGDGTFRKERIFDAGDPSFGSSGIQLVDLDRDGDLDVLYTNGDTLDSHHLKMSHGVHWLENRNEFPFTPHLLTKMPGVCRALAGDLDNDGDFDIVACAAILKEPRSPPAAGVFDSLIWLEQTEPGRFDRHSIGGPEGGYVALDLGDFNGDGALDLAAGRFKESPADWMTIWWNRGTIARERR